MQAEDNNSYAAFDGYHLNLIVTSSPLRKFIFQVCHLKYMEIGRMECHGQRRSHATRYIDAYVCMCITLNHSMAVENKPSPTITVQPREAYERGA